MVQSNTNSNSDGPVITVERTDEILNDMTGITLIVRSPFGNLCIDIPNADGNYGYLLEILSSILPLLNDGNTSIRVSLS